MCRIKFAILFLFLLSGCLFAESEFVKIPGTKYKIPSLVSDEVEITVSISSFQIGRTEVTQQRYKKVMGINPSQYKDPNKPVENVNWWDVIKYCNLRSKKENLEACYDLSTGRCDFTRNGYRLPSEAEWNLAAGKKIFANIKPEAANIGLDNTRNVKELIELSKEKGTKSVGSYPPNENGLYDMLGNVWEWCCDNYNCEILPSPSLSNPSGPQWGLEKVIRGGSFVSTPYIIKSEGYTRGSLRPSHKSRFTGFRLARTITPSSAQGREKTDTDFFKPYYQPAEKFRGLGKLPSLLVDEDGSKITNLTQWREKRKRIRRLWVDRLKIPPKPEAPPAVNIVHRFERDLYSERLMYLEGNRQEWIKALLMTPRKPISRPCPAVIVPFYDVDTPVGKNLGGHHGVSSPMLKSFAHIAAREGFIAIAVRFWELDAECLEESMINLKRRHPETTGMGKSIWDISRTVDYLYTLAEVDKERIGLWGHCAGGMMAFYAGAMDERIAVTISSGPGVFVRSSNYYDYWYLGQELYNKIDDDTDNQLLLALIAPRSLLIVLGKGNYIDQTWPYVNAARQVYSLYGKADNIGYVYDREQQVPSPSTVSMMTDWLVHFFAE